MAIGRDLLDRGREIPLGPMTVWGHNGEDPYEELQRRILAVCQHYGVTHNDLGGRLRITSGRDMPITVATELAEGRMLRPTEDGRYIAAEIKKHAIQVICLDPFVTVHRVPENDNGLMDGVMTILRDVAHQTQCAVEVAHHFRKLNGDDASVDAVRGAGALIGACRSVRIISSM
jgi:RecA-family ATPase